MIHQMEPRGLHAIPPPYEMDDGYGRPQPAYYPGPQLLPSFFKNLKADDIILIVLIILLLTEGSECDYLLVGVLIFIFLTGFDGFSLGF